jgi:hypothetical protein
MTTNQIKEIFDRVLTWPLGRQADFVRVVEFMEEHDNSNLGPPDEQAADVRQRFAY